MKFYKIFFILLFTNFFTFALQAQTVNGIVNVKKYNGVTEPMPYASVYWIEGKTVLESNDRGEFSFDRKRNDTVTLVATFVGHTRDTVVLDKSASRAEFMIQESSELEAARVITRQQGNYISKITPVKTEVISAAGLCKMACCNLAESFENSASVL